MSGVEKPMAACASYTRPAFAVAALAPCASSVNGMVTPLPNRARSGCCCIPWPWVLLLSSGVIGVEDGIDERACNCFVTNAWKCRWSSVSLPVQILRLHPCLVHNAHIIASTGLSDSLAMHEPKLLVGSLSSGSVSQKPWPPRSD